ncbi:MAG: hypothetical protein WD077_09030 [Bacteroidia bacterium]
MSDPKPSERLEIEKERQKTIRSLAMYGVLAVLIVFVVYVVFLRNPTGENRKVDVDLATGKFSVSVEQPIVDQVNVKEASYKGTQEDKSVEFTTGEVNEDVITELEQRSEKKISPENFTGQNLINKEGGYLLTVPSPEHWSVNYNAQGYNNPLVAVHTISRPQGEHVAVNLEDPGSEYSLEEYVASALEMISMAGMLSEWPEISYDHEGRTAFLSYRNPQTGGVTYQKVVKRGTKFFIVTANYNLSITPQNVQNELIKMVSTFTLIENKT